MLTLSILTVPSDLATFGSPLTLSNLSLADLATVATCERVCRREETRGRWTGLEESCWSTRERASVSEASRRTGCMCVCVCWGKLRASHLISHNFSFEGPISTIQTFSCSLQ